MFELRNELSLFLIADGFGLGQDANAAATIAINQFLKQTSKVGNGTSSRSMAQAHRIIEGGFLAASNAVEAFRDLSGTTCGASLAAICCFGRRAVVGSIGSCRAYSVRGGQLRRLMVEDSFHSNAIVDEPRNVLVAGSGDSPTRFVGDGETLLPNTVVLDLANDDRLLMLTDGVYRSLSDREVSAIVTRCASPMVPVKLVSRAREAGSDDDRAAVIVHAYAGASDFSFTAPPRRHLSSHANHFAGVNAETSSRQ